MLQRLGRLSPQDRSSWSMATRSSAGILCMIACCFCLHSPDCIFLAANDIICRCSIVQSPGESVKNNGRKSPAKSGQPAHDALVNPGEASVLVGEAGNLDIAILLS